MRISNPSVIDGPKEGDFRPTCAAFRKDEKRKEDAKAK